MNRLPRRSSRIQPPLRGRLAAVLSPQQRQRYSEPIIRPRRSLPKSMKDTNAQNRIEENSLPNSIEAEKINKQDSFPTDSIDRAFANQESTASQIVTQFKLWQWLVALIVAIILLVVIGNLI